MADWLHDLIAKARRNAPIACAGCGRTWDRADMLEAALPSHIIRGDEHFPVTFTLSIIWLVGPCCAELADQDQP